LLDECYKETTYLLDEDEFAEADEAEWVRKRFVNGWEGLVDGYRVSRVVARFFRARDSDGEEG
jgi:hypothetical protein